MNRRQFSTSIGAAAVTAASQARQALANRPLPDDGDGGYWSESKSKGKRRRRHPRGHGK